MLHLVSASPRHGRCLSAIGPPAAERDRRRGGDQQFLRYALRLAFVAPDIVTAIFESKASPTAHRKPADGRNPPACPCRKSNTNVVMMQAAKDGPRFYAAEGFNWSPRRRRCLRPASARP